MTSQNKTTVTSKKQIWSIFGFSKDPTDWKKGAGRRCRKGLIVSESSFCWKGSHLRIICSESTSEDWSLPQRIHRGKESMEAAKKEKSDGNLDGAICEYKKGASENFLACNQFKKIYAKLCLLSYASLDPSTPLRDTF